MRFLAKSSGALLVLLAFLQWITFDYPDVNPFWPGAIFAPGIFSQFLNWILVSILGAFGWLLLSYGGKTSSAQESAASTKESK